MWEHTVLMDANAFLFPKCASTCSFLAPSSSMMYMSTAKCLNSLTSTPANGLHLKHGDCIAQDLSSALPVTATAIPSHVRVSRRIPAEKLLWGLIIVKDDSKRDSRLYIGLMLLTPRPLYSDFPSFDLEGDIVRDVHQPGGDDLLHDGAALATPSRLSSVLMVCMAASSLQPRVLARDGVLA